MHNRTSVCGDAHGGNSDTGSGDFWIGVTAALIGSVTLNLGLNMQKLAFVRLGRQPAATRRNPWTDPLWLAGLVVFLIGNAGDAVGLTFTAQSVITPLGQISLVSNIYFAWLLVGERVDSSTVLATVSVIFGVVAIVIASNSTCSDFTIKELLAAVCTARLSNIRYVPCRRACQFIGVHEGKGEDHARGSASICGCTRGGAHKFCKI